MSSAGGLWGNWRGPALTSRRGVSSVSYESYSRRVRRPRRSTSGCDAPSEGGGMAGKVVHVEIPAKDSGQAKEFYGSLFGWQFQSYGEQDYHMTQFDAQSGAAISAAEP